jgi:hypothetical protein
VEYDAGFDGQQISALLAITRSTIELLEMGSTMATSLRRMEEVKWLRRPSSDVYGELIANRGSVDGLQKCSEWPGVVLAGHEVLARGQYLELSVLPWKVLPLAVSAGDGHRLSAGIARTWVRLNRGLIHGTR